MKILLAEANLRAAKTILNIRQRKFYTRLIISSDKNPVKEVLPIIFRVKDKEAQPFTQPIDDIVWAERKKLKDQLG